MIALATIIVYDPLCGAVYSIMFFYLELAVLPLHFFSLLLSFGTFVFGAKFFLCCPAFGAFSL